MPRVTSAVQQTSTNRGQGRVLVSLLQTLCRTANKVSVRLVQTVLVHTAPNVFNIN